MVTAMKPARPKARTPRLSDIALRILGILYDVSFDLPDRALILSHQTRRALTPLLARGLIEQVGAAPHTVRHRITRQGRSEFEAQKPVDAAESREFYANRWTTPEQIVAVLAWLGYDARPKAFNALGDGFEIAQGAEAHWLSVEETAALLVYPAQHPVALKDRIGGEGAILYDFSPPPTTQK